MYRQGIVWYSEGRGQGLEEGLDEHCRPDQNLPKDTYEVCLDRTILLEEEVWKAMVRHPTKISWMKQAMPQELPMGTMNLSRGINNSSIAIAMPGVGTFLIRRKQKRGINIPGKLSLQVLSWYIGSIFSSRMM